MVRTLKITAKLALAGAVIFGIGWVVLTQNADDPTDVGNVKNAQADIVDLFGQDGDEYSKAMLMLGLRPRAYDLNGNTMYFATGYADGKTPRDILRITQDELVRQGVNKENHSDMKPARTAARQVDWRKVGAYDTKALQPMMPASKAMLHGEVVPVKVSDHYVAMAGMSLKHPVDDAKDVADMYVDAYGKPRSDALRKEMDGYRFFDATAEDGLGRTMVTSVWSKKGEFDADKLENRSFKQEAPDPNIPACIGCSRDFRFQSLQKKTEPYRSNGWHTTVAAPRTYDFYRQAMANRGWKETGVQPKLDKLAQYLPEVANINGRLLNMEKDGKTMQVAILPDGTGGSHIMSIEKYYGAQPILKR